MNSTMYECNKVSLSDVIHTEALKGKLISTYLDGDLKCLFAEEEVRVCLGLVVDLEVHLSLNLGDLMVGIIIIIIKRMDIC